MRRALVVCAFLIAVSAHAAPNLRVTLDGVPSQMQPGETIRWTATVENLGPDVAENVTFRVSATPGDKCAEAELAALAVGTKHTLSCSATVSYGYVLYIQAYAFARGIPSVSAYQRVDVITKPDVVVYLDTDRFVDAALPFTFRIFAENVARTTATNVTVTIELSGATFVSRGAGDPCQGSGTTVVCALGIFAPRVNPSLEEYRHFSFDALAPDRSKAHVSATVKEVFAAEGDNNPLNGRFTTAAITYNTFNVTNTADSGPGSLRAAIEAVNAARCEDYDPCKIDFRIPPADGAKWHTIRPVAPLPVIAARYVALDANVQARHFGDTNPDGPEIEISGSSVREGNGLTVAARCNDVRGLAINDFPGYGIVVRNAESRYCERLAGLISHCYLGTDPTGNTALPNERGIVVEGVILGVTASVISGNRRSGVFITESGIADVTNSVIGLNAAKTAALGNGASGIYVAPGAHGSDVIGNYIGFNRHAGVSIGADAWYVETHTNSFQANGGLAVDYGLNGVTETIPLIALGPAFNPVYFEGTLSYPTIVSAEYDPGTDTTTLVAEVAAEKPPQAYAWYYVNFYANDEPDPSGYGEGQYYLGSVSEDDGKYVLRRPGRLPGAWVSATTTASTFWGWARTPEPHGGSRCGDCGSTWTTSEFGRTVRVSEQSSDSP